MTTFHCNCSFAGALLLLAALGGCADETEPLETSNVCDSFTTPYEDIVSGLTKVGDNGVVQVRYVSSVPAPPAEDDNSWRVQLLDASGNPLTAATVTKVQPFMPDHGHGTTVIPTIGDMDGESMVTVDDIDFRMPGVWTLTFTVETAGQVDTATFSACIN